MQEASVESAFIRMVFFLLISEMETLISAQ